MPPKVKFTKQEIVNAALNVTRVKGINAVTTRDIAAELGVSTRPIFTYFNNMEEVREEIRIAAEAVYDKYAAEGLEMKLPFPGFGAQYIRFAKDEPELYKLLFLSSPINENTGTMVAMKRSQKMNRESIQRIYHMDAQTADQYFRNMWFVVHSLATLIVTGNCPYTDKQIGEILAQMSLGLCKAYKEIPGFAESTFDKDKIFTELVKK